MDVKALQGRLAAFAAERGWDEVQNPRNLAIAIAGEAGMLLDLFRWLTDAQSHRIQSEYKRDAAEEAIADLVLHTLRLADKLGVDVERAVAKKLAENDANYPLPMEEAVASPPAASVSSTDAKPETSPLEDAKPAARKPAEAKPAEAKPAVAKPAETKPADEKPPEAKPAAAKPTEPNPAGAATADVKPAASVARARADEPRVEPRAAATASDAAEARVTTTEKSIPMWLDGILPSRGATARKKQAVAPKVVPEPAEPPKPSAPATPARKQEPAAPPAPVAALPAPEEEIEAAPPPVEAPEAAPARSEPPQPERYARLDTDAAKALAKSLAKRVDGARSDDPLLRELHDEVETLRRTLYSPTPKTSWMGESLKTIRALLDEASTHDVGEALRAHDYIAQIDRMLAP
jgi:NTP pyrophosphatase (non-canonical NTP hydrolase)